MNEYEYRKNMLEMVKTFTHIERALEMLHDKNINFEFDNYFNVSDYLAYTLDVETMFCNAVSTIEEIKNTLQTALTEVSEKVQRCERCGRLCMSDTYVINSYAALKDCNTCDME